MENKRLEEDIALTCVRNTCRNIDAEKHLRLFIQIMRKYRDQIYVIKFENLNDVISFLEKYIENIEIKLIQCDSESKCHIQSTIPNGYLV